MLLCQFGVIPRSVEALLWFNEWLDIAPDLRLSEWLALAIWLPVIFGVAFQTPLVMMVLARIGIMSVAMALIAERATEVGAQEVFTFVGVDNIASLQRGARLYFNYCSGCHSIKYMSYSRLSQDLKLSEDVVLKNFTFTGAKIGDQIVASMPEKNSENWFGKTPPDLSLEARAKGGEVGAQRRHRHASCASCRS